MGRLLSIFVPYKFLHSLFLSLSSSVMELMTNINNSEKSGGTVGKEKQNITETLLHGPALLLRCLSLFLPLPRSV